MHQLHCPCSCTDYTLPNPVFSAVSVRLRILDASSRTCSARNAMSWLATLVLSLLHVLYKLVLLFKSLSTHFLQEPLSLASERSKVPSHLALNLISNPEEDEEGNEKYMLNSVENVAAWCQVVGIRRLTVYDHDGKRC